MKTKISAAVVLAMFVFAVGCAHNLSTDSYNALNAAATSYENTMAAVQEMLDQGILDEDDRQEIRKVAVAYWAVYHTAVDALAAYNKTKGLDRREALLEARDELLAQADRLRERLSEVRKEVL